MILSYSKPVIKSVDDVKQYSFVRILYLKNFPKNKIDFSVEHQIELGDEVLDGQQSNNPLYQLAEEYHLLNEDHSQYFCYLTG